MEKRTVTKRELCERIAKETGLTQVAVKASVQGFLDAIIEELSKGNRLEFRDFGVFDTRVQAARKARNPRTGEEVFVSAKAVAYFKLGKKMEDTVQKSLDRYLPEMQSGGLPKSQPVAAATTPQPVAPASAMDSTNTDPEPPDAGIVSTESEPGVTGKQDPPETGQNEPNSTGF